MRFIAKTVMNAQGFTSEAKEVILSLCKAYMGNFSVRFEVITGYHSGDSRENVNEIHRQFCDECTGIYLWHKRRNSFPI